MIGDVFAIAIYLGPPTWLAGMFVLWRLKHIRQTTAAKVYLAFFTILLWIMLFGLNLTFWMKLYPPSF